MVASLAPRMSGKSQPLPWNTISGKPDHLRPPTSNRGCNQPGLDMRHGVNQLACVSGLRIVEHGPAFALFDDASILQHDGSVAHHANDVEVVADKEEGEVTLAPQAIEQLQHYR